MNMYIKIKMKCYQIKWAFQRIIKGYDEKDVYDFHDTFVKKMVLILQEYQKYNAQWWIPEMLQNLFPQKQYFSKEQTEAILDVMINHFKMSDEEYVLQLLYGEHSSYLLDYKDWERVFKIRQQNQDRAMELLKIFLNNIWV